MGDPTGGDRSLSDGKHVESGDGLGGDDSVVIGGFGMATGGDLPNLDVRIFQSPSRVDLNFGKYKVRSLANFGFQTRDDLSHFTKKPFIEESKKRVNIERKKDGKENILANKVVGWELILIIFYKDSCVNEKLTRRLSINGWHGNLIQPNSFGGGTNFCFLKKGYITSTKHHQYIKRSNTTSTDLTWLQRLEICVGADFAVDHTFNRFDFCYANFESPKILLNNKWVAEVTDFWICKSRPTDGVPYDPGGCGSVKTRGRVLEEGENDAMASPLGRDSSANH